MSSSSLKFDKCNSEDSTVDVSHFKSSFLDISNSACDILESKLSDINLSYLTSFENVELGKILPNICVSHPYFAFDTIYKKDDVFITKLPVEQKITFESTPVSSAEASRHLAILATCAISSNESEKHYYLSEEGRMSLIENNIIDFDSDLYVIAVKTASERKKASAVTALVNIEGKILYVFDIRFLKLRVNLFNKIFADTLEPTPTLDYNPYKNIRGLTNIRISNNRINANLPIIPKEDCSGHFDNAPMMPIGILAYMLINQIGLFLKNIHGGQKFNCFLNRAEIILFNPSSIKREEPLEIIYNGNIGKEHFFSWKVFSADDGTLLNEMKISFIIST